MRIQALVLADGGPEDNPRDWWLEPNAKGELPTGRQAILDSL